MTEAAFFLGLSLLVAGIVLWGLVVLPRENMQMLAVLPRRRRADGSWEGLNLTWYGIMQALGVTLGLAVTVVLAGSLGVSQGFMGRYLLAILGVSLPAARLVAGVLEKRRGTFTVGGAVFVALLLALPIGWVLDTMLCTHDTPRLLSAVAIGYPLGEGIGRLACISFGCCYGKRISDLGPRLQSIFAPIAAVPRGRTRKASYAGGCDGEPLVATQAISAVALSLFALSGVGLFLTGFPRLGAAMALSLTHAFRFGVEFLRADNRGGGRISPYQWMSVASIPPVVAIFSIRNSTSASAELHHLTTGLDALGSPSVLAALLGTGLVVFLYLGRSRVTSADVRFSVRDV